MRKGRVMLAGLLAGTAGLAGAAAPSADQPLKGGATFISPMGEPFHSNDTASGAEQWFRGADADHDNRISRAELVGDADRFFALLDVNHDGEIDPAEITHYESEVAPEIQVVSTIGDMSQAKTDDQGNFTPPPYPTRLGAGRYGFLDMPEPVAAADANLDRAVSKSEFEMAARRRFKMLDTDDDGFLTRAELPKLEVRSQDDNSRRRKKRKPEG